MRKISNKLIFFLSMIAVTFMACNKDGSLTEFTVTEPEDESIKTTLVYNTLVSPGDVMSDVYNATVDFTDNDTLVVTFDPAEGAYLTESMADVDLVYPKSNFDNNFTAPKGTLILDPTTRVYLNSLEVESTEGLPFGNPDDNYNFRGGIRATSILSAKEEQALLTEGVGVSIADPATTQMLFNDLTEAGDIKYYKTTYFDNQPYTIVKPAEAARFTSLTSGNVEYDLKFNETGVYFTGGNCQTGYDPASTVFSRAAVLNSLRANVDPILDNEQYLDINGANITALVQNTK